MRQSQQKYFTRKKEMSRTRNYMKSLIVHELGKRKGESSFEWSMERPIFHTHSVKTILKNKSDNNIMAHNLK